MNRPSSAPASRPGAGTVPQQQRVVGHKIGGGGEPAQSSSPLAGQRAEYRPRSRAGASGARGNSKGNDGRRERGTSASRRRKEIVSEYMRVHVDPVMHEMITHLLLVRSEDVAGAMLAYLRAVRDGGDPAPGGDASRKVSRTDRVYMVREISPLLTEILSDVVRARPRAPVDFIIAWLASRAAKAAPEAAAQPPTSVRNKLRDAVSFDAAVGACAVDGDAVPETAEAAPAVVPAVAPAAVPAAVNAAAAAAEKKRIDVKAVFVLGNHEAGKTTLLKAMQGETEIKLRPSSGFRKFDVGHDDDGYKSTMRFFDVGGKAKARKNWVAYFQDAHAVLFVVDCSKPLAEARESFDFIFRPTVGDPQRGYLKGKPVLILANKQDVEGAHAPDAVAAALDLDGYQAACAPAFGDVSVAVCPVVSDPPHAPGGTLDERIVRAVEWLAARIDDDGARLERRVLDDCAAEDAREKEIALAKERRVFRKTLRKAWPAEGGEPEECFDAADGLEFIAQELGLKIPDPALPGGEIPDLHPTAAALAKLVNYQKLAMQMIGNFKNPINVKKKPPKSWPEIDDYVRKRDAEKWDPAWLKQDELDDPTSAVNRAKRAAEKAAGN